ncbi:MAG: RNA polymerase sigma factor [Acidobacteriota bacterium]
MTRAGDARLRAAREGDTGAFEALYRSSVAQVYGACRRLTRDDAQAEDATQRAYLRAWERLDDYRGDGSFTAWVRRIAVHLLIDERRRTWREPLCADEQIFEAVPAAPRRSSAAAVDLERAVRSLPDGARQVFALHDIEGFTHAEIAELLGVSIGTTKTQLFRARRALRSWLT